MSSQQSAFPNYNEDHSQHDDAHLIDRPDHPEHFSSPAHTLPPHGHQLKPQDRPEFKTRGSGRVRTLSSIHNSHRKNEDAAKWAPPRRFSDDFDRGKSHEFEIYVDETYAALIAREDTDKNVQITVEDKGPKWISLGSLSSDGYLKRDIRTTYHLSNLLQELYLAKEKGEKRIVLSEDAINENPVCRLSRFIKDEFWTNLTRRIDGSNIAMVGRDPKDWNAHPRPRIYVPVGAPEQHAYYTRVAREHPEMDLDVVWLSADPSNEEYVRDLNDAPGLLALEMERIKDTRNGEPDFRGLPFVVPGGRFNELYGWDSYMESLGLISNGKVNLAKNMVKHFCFCIKHYGKILNANRTYYLCRTQPPFLTDMALRVYDKTKQEKDAKQFLRIATLAAIKEYYSVWTVAPRYDPETGLSRYRAQGIGVPPETEASHFEHILTPYAKKHGMTYSGFIRAYNYGKVHEPELDKFFLHDRAVRESGHDTSYRLENHAAEVDVVDLNSCLYKYEIDIAHIIGTEFDGRLEVPADFCARGCQSGNVETTADWTARAAHRKHLFDKYLWNAEQGMYFDYHCVEKRQTGYESATTFWALWAGVASPEQAKAMVKHALPKFEVGGGLVSGTEASRGSISLSRPNRQWDYPFGWAPQQILAWHGLQRYGFDKEAKRLAYRWLHMVTRAFVDFNGVVVEKYNVTDPKRPHIVAAEYGNQGSDFKGRPREGFGWVNASYIVGLDILDQGMRRRLGALASWDEYREKKNPRHRASSFVVQPPLEHDQPTAPHDNPRADQHHAVNVPQVVHEATPLVIGSTSVRPPDPTHPIEVGADTEHEVAKLHDHHAEHDSPHQHDALEPKNDHDDHTHGSGRPAGRFMFVDGATDWKDAAVFT